MTYSKQNKRLAINGFTLLELLLVIVIIGLLLVVIVPRAWQARIDAKYGLVRTNCSELASFANQWAEKGIQAQDENTSTATLANYFASLALSPAGEGKPDAEQSCPGCWIAVQGENNNWNNRDDNELFGINGRRMIGSTEENIAPEDAVQDIVPPDKIFRNPFNGINVFSSPNDPAAQDHPVTGAVAAGGFGEPNTGTTAGGWAYYALCFQGTDSKSILLTGDTADEPTFHAGQKLDTYEGLRNGIFLGRSR